MAFSNQAFFRLLIIVVTFSILCVACKSNPHLPIAKQFAKQNNIEMAHQYFRKAIKETPDNPAPFSAYIKWLPPMIDKRSMEVRFQVESITEVNNLQRKKQQLLALGRELKESYVFLEPYYRPDIIQFVNAWNFFTAKIPENYKLITNSVAKIDEKIEESKYKSAHQYNLGLKAYRNMLFDQAYNHFDKSISFNTNNTQTRYMLEKINAYEHGLGLHAQKMLDDALKHFSGMYRKYDNDQVMTTICSQKLFDIRTKIEQSKGFLRRGDFFFTKKMYQKAWNQYKKAPHINKNTEPFVKSRMASMSLSDKAWKNYSIKAYAFALEHLKQARKNSPDLAVISKWIKKIQRKYDQQQAVLFANQGVQFIYKGEVKAAKELFDKAVKIAVNKSAIKKTIKTARKLASKKFAKQGKLYKTQEMYYKAYVNFNSCNQILKSRACQKQAKKLVVKVEEQFALMAQKALEANNIGLALFAYKASLEFNAGNKDLLIKIEQTKDKVLKRSTLIIHGMSAENQNAYGNAKDMQEQFVKLLSDNHLRFRIAKADEKLDTAGYHLRLQNNLIIEGCNADAAENKEVCTEPLNTEKQSGDDAKKVYLQQMSVSTIDGRKISDISTADTLTAEDVPKLFADVIGNLTAGSKMSSQESKVFYNYLYDPPKSELTWKAVLDL